MFWLSASKYWLLCSASRIVWRTTSTRAAGRDGGWEKRRSTYSGLICLAALIHININHYQLYEQLERPSPGSDVGSIEVLRAGRTPSGSGGMDMSPGLGKLYLILKSTWRLLYLIDELHLLGNRYIVCLYIFISSTRPVFAHSNLIFNLSL